MCEAMVKRWFARLGIVLMVAGVFTIAAPAVYAMYGNWAMQRLQAEALEKWRPASLVADAGGAAPPTTDPRDDVAALTNRWPWRLEIPKIGLRWLIYEGADVQTLRQHGAGHIEWTTLPRLEGTVGIAGHRTTYGAPFFQLHRLEPGDIIRLITAQGVFVYEVTESHEVLPRETQVLESVHGTARLALVACSPPFSAKFRLVVLARLTQFQPYGVSHIGR